MSQRPPRSPLTDALLSYTTLLRSVRVGINGCGRIGLNFYRAVRASGADIEVVAVNDLTDNASLAHLLKFDTILGRLDAEVSSSEGAISVGESRIRAFAERNPANIGWGDEGIDVVVESTGFFTDGDKARAHVEQGGRSEEHTSELKSLMRNSYAV